MSVRTEGEARTQSRTKDLLITSEMRYHCAIRAVGVYFRKVKYTNSIFSYFVALAVKMPIGRLLPMKFGNNVSKERDSVIAITLFHPSWSEFELRTFSGQFRKQEKQTNIWNQPYFWQNSTLKGPRPLEGKRSVAHFFPQNPISCSPVKTMVPTLCVMCQTLRRNTSTRAEGEATTSVVGQRCQ